MNYTNPCADAEAWEDRQDLQERKKEAVLTLATKKMEKHFDSLSAVQWAHLVLPASMARTAMDIFDEAIEGDDELRSAMSELLTSEAAQKVRHLLAARYAEEMGEKIVGADK